MTGRGTSSRRVWTALPLGLLAVCATLIAGCGSSDDSVGTDPPNSTTSTTTPAGELTVTVDPSTAKPGDQLQAVVVNGSAKQYTYGAGYELEQQVKGTWRKVELPPTPVPDIGYIAPPGKDGPPVTVEVPNDAQAGTWRVVIARYPPVGLLSGEFTVAGN